MRRLLYIVVLLIAQGCNISTDTPVSLMPKANGSIGEIILVMDTSQWNRPLGVELKSIFSGITPGLPRDEAMYNVHFIDPDRLNNVLKTATNMVFVATMDGTQEMTNFFTKSSWDRIKEDPEIFMNTAQNQFARNQEILQLFGQNEEMLLKNIRENRELIRSYFNEVEKKRLIKEYKRNRSEKDLEKLIQRTFGLGMHVPRGFRTAIAEDDFLWIRDAQYDIDRSIFITYKNYTSESMFEKDSIINWRNEIAKKYLFGDPEEPLSYVKTEVDFAEVHDRKVNFNDNFAVEIRALWRTNKIVGMGGPFISYTFLDQNTNRLYYIEAFLYSPGVQQRSLMKKLEAILWTFKTENEDS